MFKNFPNLFVFIFCLSLTFQSSSMDWNSATDAETQNSACTNLTPPSKSEMENYLLSKIDDPSFLINKNTLGVQFENESPELIELFEKIHVQEFTINSKTPVLPRSRCHKVICALDQFYGKGTGLPILYVYAKYGLSMSPLSAAKPSNYQNWKRSEIDDLLIALETTPPNLLPFKNRHLLHFKDGYSLAIYGQDTSVIANARIDIFDIWNEQSRLSRIATLVHEIGHVLGSKLDDSNEWKSMPKKYISEYSKTNAAEDFAESFLAYRFAPRKLQKLSLERFNFLKSKVFSGLTFFAKGECITPFNIAKNKVSNIIDFRREVVSWVKKNRETIAIEEKRQEEFGAFAKRAFTKCAPVYLDELQSNYSFKQTESCIKNTILKRATIVTARNQGHEESEYNKINLELLKDISVSKKTLSLIRHEFYLNTLSSLEEIYDQVKFYSSFDKCSEKDFRFYFQYRELNPENELILQSSLGMSSLVLACEKDKDRSVIKDFIGPDFESIIREARRQK